MLVIRLQRMGKKNQPFFRIVLAEKTAPIKGKYIEKLGFLDPRKKTKNLNAEKIKYWIEKGAQCSDTAWNLFVKEGVIKGKKRAIKIKSKKKGEAEQKEALADSNKKQETGAKEGGSLKQEEKTQEKLEETEVEKTKEKPAPVKAMDEAKSSEIKIETKSAPDQEVALNKADKETQKKEKIEKVIKQQV